MKNKRADIPVMILVLGVIAICGLAILSFIISEKNIFPEGESLGIEVFEQLYSDVEKFEFYINVGDSCGYAAGKIKTSEIDAYCLENKLVLESKNDIISVKYKLLD